MSPDVARRLQSLRVENAVVRGRMDEQRPRFEEMAERHRNGTGPRAVAAWQLFQTRPTEAAKLVARLELRPGARILEPSAGLGRLLDALKIYAPGEVVAVDVSAACMAELYRQARPGVTLKQRDFLSVGVDELGRFDAVAMNPPFENGADIRHIRHALGFLAPGGICAAICAGGPRQERILRALSESWDPLPADAFVEAGTNARAILATFRAPS